MTYAQLSYFLSVPRFNIYMNRSGNDQGKAVQLYKENIALSEAFYPILAILEVSLRNAINEQLTTHFNDPFWFKNNLPAEFGPYVSKATHKLVFHHKKITAEKIIAELNFGFWNRLFNRNYTHLLWKPLRLIFKNTPKHLRQRDEIDDMLSRMRRLRNRIYHYGPIFEDLQQIEAQYNEMLTFLSWLDNDLPELLTDVDRFKKVLEKVG